MTFMLANCFLQPGKKLSDDLSEILPVAISLKLDPKDVPELQKFILRILVSLYSQISGEAQKLSQNFDSTLEILKQVFENLKIIFAHVSSLKEYTEVIILKHFNNIDAKSVLKN